MLKLLISILVISTINCNLSNAERSFSGQLGQYIAQCFGENELVKCFENKTLEALNQAIANNETWKVSDFLVAEKNIRNLQNEQNITKGHVQQEPLNDNVALRILQLAQTRSIKSQLPPSSISKIFTQRNISSALEDFSPSVSDVDAAESGVSIAQQLEQEEGRKRKHTDKHIALMGGMAMLAMLAQMFLGKVILIAGAAFVMAKVALLISTLGSLKKGPIASPASTDHVIVTGGSGVSGDHSHEHISSWHRRTPFKHNIYQAISPTDHKFAEPM